jgi:hypothetical protein
MESSGIFDMLPVEVNRIIFSFCDIPSLGNIAQTGSNALAQYASDDTTWAKLVERRFRIATKKSSPRLNGGHTWKHAYSSMSISDRIPKAGRYTSSQKIVFAKSRSNQRKGNGSVSLWVLMGHTENCKTRTVRQCERARGESNNERYVELYLCMQNVKSGGGEVTVDVVEATLVLMGSSGSCDPLVSRVCKTGLSLWPRLLFHDTMEAVSPKLASDVDPFNDCDISNGVKLRPFDVVVVSVHFPCASDIFETDFLARAVSLHVPVRKPGEMTKETCDATISVASSSTSARNSMALIPPHASAFFIPENVVWNYYMELPGGFLALVDRFQMLTI